MTELLTSVYTCFANLACKNGFYRHLRMICCCLGRERGLCTNQLTDDLSACTGFAARAAANPCRWKGCLSRSINSCPFQNCSRLCIVCCSAYAYIHKIEKEFPGLATKLLCICIFTYVRKERDNTVVSFLLPPTNFSFFPLVAAAFLWNKVPRILYSTCGTMFVNDGGFVTDICKSAATEERAVRDYKSCEVDQLTCHGPSKLGQVAMVSLQMYPTSIVIRGAMLQNAPWWRAVRCRNGELVLKQGPTWAQRMTLSDLSTFFSRQAINQLYVVRRFWGLEGPESHYKFTGTTADDETIHSKVWMLHLHHSVIAALSRWKKKKPVYTLSRK